MPESDQVPGTPRGGDGTDERRDSQRHDHGSRGEQHSGPELRDEHARASRHEGERDQGRPLRPLRRHEQDADDRQECIGRPDGSDENALERVQADELVLSALRAGAAGFLLKDTPPAELVAGDADADRRHEEARERMATLSEREREVALALGRGLANAEIASELFMSVAMVKAYVSRLFTKLGVENRVQIALLVQEAQR
jgi:DNA-binding CsgD family transcriptional regulator